MKEEVSILSVLKEEDMLIDKINQEISHIKMWKAEIERLSKYPDTFKEFVSADIKDYNSRIDSCNSEITVLNKLLVETRKHIKSMIESF